MSPPPTPEERTRRRLARQVTRTCAEWDLLREGDRVMVAVSGGKDSYTLLDLLWEARRRAPFSFDVIAVHLDQKQPGYDGAPLRRWLERSGIPFEIVERDTYSTVVDLTPEGKTFCAVCSRLRRGVLYNVAERLGCNIVALGHHRDDALETLLMNLFFGGKLQAMPARYRTDDGRFDVVRPLIDCAEREIAAHATAAGYPILPCNLCGSQSGLQRERMKQLLDQLEAQHPDVRAVMGRALHAVHPSHLLDADVAAVWAARPHSGTEGEEFEPGDLVTLRRQPSVSTRS
jgi:tRNA 2-thiocytidine biosynthesis protein TtcA